MAKHILVCPACKEYTMQEKCQKCGTDSVQVRPAKYSPDDKYAELRRKMKEEEYKERGLL